MQSRIANQSLLHISFAQRQKGAHEEPQQQQQFILATSIAGVWLALFCSQQVPSVARQLSVHSVVVCINEASWVVKDQSGLLSSLFRLDEPILLVVSAGIHALHFTEEEHDNNQNLVDC